MALAETNILKRIMMTASKASSRLFRNNVGLFTTDKGDKVMTGLCKGSSDLIGWTPVVITEDMVGQQVAVFTAVEVKTERRRPTPDQKNFVNKVNEPGGFAVIALSREDILQIVRKIK